MLVNNLNENQEVAAASGYMHVETIIPEDVDESCKDLLYRRLRSLRDRERAANAFSIFYGGASKTGKTFSTLPYFSLS